MTGFAFLTLGAALAVVLLAAQFIEMWRQEHGARKQAQRS
jgi:hypothetical protein